MTPEDRELVRIAKSHEYAERLLLRHLDLELAAIAGEAVRVPRRAPRAHRRRVVAVKGASSSRDAEASSPVRRSGAREAVP